VVLVRGVTFRNMLKTVNQSQHYDSSDQSEQIVVFKTRSFTQTGNSLIRILLIGWVLGAVTMKNNVF